MGWGIMAGLGKGLAQAGTTFGTAYAEAPLSKKRLENEGLDQQLKQMQIEQLVRQGKSRDEATALINDYVTQQGVSETLSGLDTGGFFPKLSDKEITAPLLKQADDPRIKQILDDQISREKITNTRKGGSGVYGQRKEAWTNLSPERYEAKKQELIGQINDMVNRGVLVNDETVPMFNSIDANEPWVANESLDRKITEKLTKPTGARNTVIETTGPKVNLAGLSSGATNTSLDRVSDAEQKEAEKIQGYYSLISKADEYLKPELTTAYIGKPIKEVLGKTDTDFARFYTNFYNYANQYRNSLFGASLTDGEQKAFDSFLNMNGNVSVDVLKTQINEIRDAMKNSYARKIDRWEADNRKVPNTLKTISYTPKKRDSSGNVVPDQGPKRKVWNEATGKFE